MFGVPIHYFCKYVVVHFDYCWDMIYVKLVIGLLVCVDAQLLILAYITFHVCVLHTYCPNQTLH